MLLHGKPEGQLQAPKPVLRTSLGFRQLLNLLLGAPLGLRQLLNPLLRAPLSFRKLLKPLLGAPLGLRQLLNPLLRAPLSLRQGADFLCQRPDFRGQLTHHRRQLQQLIPEEGSAQGTLPVRVLLQEAQKVLEVFDRKRHLRVDCTMRVGHHDVPYRTTLVIRSCHCTSQSVISIWLRGRLIAAALRVVAVMATVTFCRNA